MKYRDHWAAVMLAEVGDTLEECLADITDSDRKPDTSTDYRCLSIEVQQGNAVVGSEIISAFEVDPETGRRILEAAKAIIAERKRELNVEDEMPRESESDKVEAVDAG